MTDTPTEPEPEPEPEPDQPDPAHADPGSNNETDNLDDLGHERDG